METLLKEQREAFGRDLDTALTTALTTALNNTLSDKLGLGQNQRVNLRQMEQEIQGTSERVETMDRRVGFLLYTVPTAALKDKRIHVVGYGSSIQDAAVLGSKKGT